MCHVFRLANGCSACRPLVKINSFDVTTSFSIDFHHKREKRDDFDQQTAWGAPIWWSKNTTLLEKKKLLSPWRMFHLTSPKRHWKRGTDVILSEFMNDVNLTQRGGGFFVTQVQKVWGIAAWQREGRGSDTAQICVTPFINYPQCNLASAVPTQSSFFSFEPLVNICVACISLIIMQLVRFVNYACTISLSISLVF